MIDGGWMERQYNTSFSVANEDLILADWIARAERTRHALSFEPNITYGAHQREVLDFYRAPQAKGTLIYIHGGYWRMLSKVETSWVADGFIDHGASVALINYPLCPEVTLSDIRHSIIRSFVHLYTNVLNDEERKNIVMAGHSAGGYLAALHLATDWAKFGLPENPIAGVIAISGIYDVAPLMLTSMNADIQITAKTASQLNMMMADLKSSAPIVFVVGENEPQEFHRQSADQAKAWAALKPKILTLERANHFTVVDALATPGSEISNIACAMLSSKI